AVTLAVALAVAAAAETGFTVALALGRARALALGARLDAAGTLALGVAGAADLAALALHLGAAGLDLRVAARRAVRHRVDGRRALGLLRLDLVLALGVGFEVSDELCCRVACGLGLLARALALRRDIRVGGSEILRQVRAGHGDIALDLRRELLDGESAAQAC